MIGFIILSILLGFVSPCYIHGTDSGNCVPHEEFKEKMPFCGDVVRYPACVPKEYSYFPNHTLQNKDLWARDAFDEIVSRRLLIENKNFPADIMSWEGGGKKVQKYFTENRDCMNAYKNFLCYMNFPRCDETGTTLLLCRSVCENFVKACNIGKHLSRCYNFEYYGGKSPEPDTLTDSLGLPVYMRSWYPGQPFRDNEFNNGDKDDPRVVCTPSLHDGVNGVYVSVSILFVSFLMFLYLM